MDIRKLQRAIVDGLEDVKAHNIVVFNTEHLSPLFERVIIASGTSNRQTKALASSVRETVKARGLTVLRTEGEENGEWIIVDCGAAVVHLMQPAIRDYYHLEELWGEKSVKMKLDGQAATLVKASPPEAARKTAARSMPDATKTGASAKTRAAAPPARKASAGKAPAGKAPAGKSAAGKSAASKSTAGKAAARKAPAGKASASRATSGRAPAGKVPARKSAAKPASRKTIVRKVVARKAGSGA
jgi:ribosome-associated protein